MSGVEELRWAFKALGCKRRLDILELLMRNKEMTVGEMSETLRAPISTISRNLAVLSKAGFVAGRNRGTYLFYSIQKEDVHPCNVALLALVKNASVPKKKSKVKALISAAMFDPRLAKYLEVLSWED